METILTEKLRGTLSGALSEERVVYILSMLRKLLEYRDGTARFSYLRFFTDWAFHVRVDRMGAQRALRHFDGWLPELTQNQDRGADACGFFLLFGFHLEFQWLLRELGLPRVTNEWWCEFLRCYLDVVANCPVSGGVDLGLKHLQELSIASDNGYCWKVTLKSGEVKRFEFDPKDFFAVRPTSSGEPWLWKGPVAAMVGCPEGWVVDNEQGAGFQFCMYPVLCTREQAKKKSVFLYGNILLKYEDEPTMEAIAARHERTILEHFPAAKFQRLPPLESEARPEGQFPRTLLRRGDIDPSYGGPEYSLYVESPKGVLLLVLLCPAGTDDTYLPVLRWIGSTVLMMTREEGDQAAEAPSISKGA